MVQSSVQLRSVFSEFLDLLLRLHALVARGMSDSAEADEVRDLMDEPWARLTTQEESRSRGLSADLYTVGVDRATPASVSDEIAEQVGRLRDSEDWDGLLGILRDHEAELINPSLRSFPISLLASHAFNLSSNVELLPVNVASISLVVTDLPSILKSNPKSFSVCSVSARMRSSTRSLTVWGLFAA